ncbi:MAG: hypothetical protein M9894_19380 [Planctomycetes bacterium]|nr:hypothetical protein [Planctomycetota bacterium]
MHPRPDDAGSSPPSGACMSGAEEEPSAWRRIGRWARPALARGLAWGACVALLLLPPFALLVGARPTATDLLGLALIAAACVGAGLLGAGPTAFLEARARERAAPGRWGLVAACGLSVAAAWVVVIAQTAYLAGALRGGVEGGLNQLGALVGGFGSDLNQHLGGTLGLIVAVATSFTLTVLLRVQGCRRATQAFGGCAIAGCGGATLFVVTVIAMAVIGGTGDDPFERAVALPGLGLVFAAAGVGSLALITLGAPLALLAPLALGLADRLAPPPVAPAPDHPPGDASH